jgi:hypothetical protein
MENPRKLQGTSVKIAKTTNKGENNNIHQMRKAYFILFRVFVG